MKNIVFNVVKKIKWKIRAIKIKRFETKLIKIRKSVDGIVGTTHGEQQRPTVLFALSFSLWQPNKVHDFLLSQALRLRGFQLISLVEGKLQEGETSLFGGVFGDYTSNMVENKIREQQNFLSVQREDYSLWRDWVGIEPYKLSDYISSQEKAKLLNLAQNYDVLCCENWTYDEMPVGKWVLDVLRNNETICDLNRIQNYELKAKNYLVNTLFMIEASKNAFKAISPDIIVSNNSFYYPWSIWEILAKRNKISFYCGGPAEDRLAWHYAYNSRAIPADLSDLWQIFAHIDLSAFQVETVVNYLKKRTTGDHAYLNTANPRKNSMRLLKDDLRLDITKPTVLLAANVVWDAAALNVDVQFKNMFDWVLQVIDFFSQHQEFNLVIKAHPVEKNMHLPVTRQLLGDEIKAKWRILPSNVIFLDPTTNLSVYELFDIVDLGLVYTSTVGLELACRGIGVMTAARSPYHNKGFTYDTQTREQYFDSLKKFLVNKESFPYDQEQIKKQARKFLYLYHFVYAVKLNLFDYDVAKGMRLLITGIDDLKPCGNKGLDMICAAIEAREPIFTKERLNL